MREVLITVEQAVGQLRLPTGFASGSPLSVAEQDLVTKMEDATAIVLDYIHQRDDHGWTVETVPGWVRAAILEQLVELWRFRGDDVEAGAPTQPDGYLSRRIANKLHREKDPTLA